MAAGYREGWAASLTGFLSKLFTQKNHMSEDIDKHVTRKYEVGQRIGKGVCRILCLLIESNFVGDSPLLTVLFGNTRLTALYGRRRIS
jgi:hypothetical protein